jgi:ubiquinone/menaquinone biosynthesis C-methylase UbiE
MINMPTNPATAATGYESQWNDTYGLDRDPVRKYLIHPLLKAEAGDLQSKHILDAGSGNGNLLRLLSELNFAGAVGLDASTDFIASAKSNVADLRVKFVQCNFEQTIPIESERFDTAFSVFVLNELLDTDLHLRELSRLLKPHAELHIIATHPFYGMYYHLYERFTGNPNQKLPGIGGYFDRVPARYVFTLVQDITARFFHHTFEDFLNPLAESGMNIVKLLELKTDNIEFRQIPSYWETRDIPKYLYIKARKI